MTAPRTSERWEWNKPLCHAGVPMAGVAPAQLRRRTA